ncbi:MAG: DUF255 domain-containing protein [Dokdonella sp.]
MRQFLRLLLLALPCVAALPAAAAQMAATSSTDAFAQARREYRYVILDLEAVWCHWCHVMDRETYANKGVQEVLAKNYVVLRLDQDAHPDFAARYGEWGWPATIVFAPDGRELYKHRGYIEASAMIDMLNAIVDDPTPRASAISVPVVATATATLTAEQRKTRLDDYVGFYDAEHGDWGDTQRYIDAASVELAIELARDGDAQAEHMARQTLDGNLALIDPVWGGVYQYSIGPGWDRPHFEKIMSFQANDLRLYALAYATWKDPKYLQAARAIERYLTGFLLAPDGAFYVSQDADLGSTVDGHVYYALDDAARRARGLPRIDRHRYTRENAWAISALCQVHDSLGDAHALALATRAAHWVIAHRALRGGFRHDEKDAAGPYLADNMAMANALLSLYRSTGERAWLTRAETTLVHIDAYFRAHDAGYQSSPPAEEDTGALAEPVRNEDENVALARIANLAWRSTANPRFQRMSEHAARYALAWANAHPKSFTPGLLLIDRELSAEPLHVAVVGARDDAQVQALHAAALAYPALYRRIDWWDPREGPLPNPDVTYPKLARPAAFVCTGNACSPPVFEPQQVAVAVDRLRTLATHASD